MASFFFWKMFKPGFVPLQGEEVSWDISNKSRWLGLISCTLTLLWASDIVIGNPWHRFHCPGQSGRNTQWCIPPRLLPQPLLSLTISLFTGGQPHPDLDGLPEPAAPEPGAAALRGQHQQSDHPAVSVTVAYSDPLLAGHPGTSAWTVLNSNERAEEYGRLSRAGEGSDVWPTGGGDGLGRPMSSGARLMSLRTCWDYGPCWVLSAWWGRSLQQMLVGARTIHRWGNAGIDWLSWLQPTIFPHPVPLALYGTV